MTDENRADENRVLMLASSAADAVLSRSILVNAGMKVCACQDMRDLNVELEVGAGVLLLSEEVLLGDAIHSLARMLCIQPAWSDISCVLLAMPRTNSDFIAKAMDILNNVTVLERPIHMSTLVSVVRSGIRARRRQYQLRDQIEALRRSEERFRLMAKAGDDTLWDLDLETRRRSLFNSGANVPAGSYSEWKERLHPDDRERIDASFQSAIQGGESAWSDEYRFSNGDDGYIDILDRGYIVRDEKGVALRAVGAMMDITERNHSARLSALYGAIVESSEDAMISKNLDGIVLSWNAAAERLFGYTAQEAQGQPLTLIVPPGLHGEEANILARLREGRGTSDLETVRMKKNGDMIDVAWSVSPIRDRYGKVVGASTIVRNITPRKLAEAALRKQTERLHLLLQAASVLLMPNEPESMMRGLFGSIAPHLGLDVYLHFRVGAGGNALRLSSHDGISPDQAAGIARLDFEQDICGDVARRRQRIVAESVQTSDDPMAGAVRQFGIRAYVCSPLLVDGHLLGTLGFGTRRKDRFDGGELEFLDVICRYVTMACERMDLIGQLRETDRRKDEFMATLAHELRNPLAPIRNALRIVQLDESDASMKQRAQRMMQRQFDQLVRLVDDLLDISRITSGKLELRRERVELATILANAEDMSRPLIEAADHELVAELPRQAVYLDADPVRLTQVFSNLFNNAAKYMDRGGRIRLGVALESKQVVVKVRDDGIGIPAEALDSIFDMFVQLWHMPGKSREGLGVGLTLVKLFVEMHGGSVAAYSAGAGQGVEFTVRLPLAATTAVVPTKTAIAGKRAAASTCRILVADDNRDTAESLSILLRLMGAEVRTVYDGVQAVEEAAAFRPHMALLDIGMPRMNGHEAARQMRRHRWGKHIMLVAVTGWGQEKDRQTSLEAGFDRHFTKPLDPASVESVITELRMRSALH